MITNSYSASCYIENEDGQYNITCDMDYDGKKIHSSYQGNNFVNGLNKIMDDITVKMIEQPKPQQEETLEDKVVRLEQLVAKLQNENHSLNKFINELINECNNCTKNEEENKNISYSIDDLIKDLTNTVNNFKTEDIKKNNDNLNSTLLNWDNFWK